MENLTPITKTYSSLGKWLRFLVAIIGLGLILTMGFFLSRSSSVDAMDSKLLELANMKKQEVMAESQIQMWTSQKTQATKGILKINGEMAKLAQSQGLKTMPTQL